MGVPFLSIFVSNLHSMPRHLTEFDKGRLVGMIEAGKSISWVASKIHVHRNTVKRWWYRYSSSGATNRKEGSGRPKLTTESQNRHLCVAVKRNRFTPLSRLYPTWRIASNVNCSYRTARRIVFKAGLRARRPLIRIPLPPRNRRLRLEWAKSHIEWTIEQWSAILWTDESRFTLDYADGRVRVRRLRGERFSDCCIKEHDRHGGGSLMIWAGVWGSGRTPLVRINGTLDAQKYRTQIVLPFIVPTVQDYHLTLQQDNARPHVARIVSQTLEENHVPILPWPSRSPDFSPIEHLWDELGRSVRHDCIHPTPTNLNELMRMLEEKWNAISPETIRNAVLSMPSRLQQCLGSRGGHTNY